MPTCWSAGTRLERLAFGTALAVLSASLVTGVVESLTTHFIVDRAVWGVRRDARNRLVVEGSSPVPLAAALP
jgi:hypothetical protein